MCANVDVKICNVNCTSRVKFYQIPKIECAHATKFSLYMKRGYVTRYYLKA
jgi:hypothetical protein